MFLVGIPLLIIPFAIYNMIAFLTPGVEWRNPLATIPMMSGARWDITAQDGLLTFAILLLPQAATSTFFLLMMIALVDVMGGFVITARAARRDVAVEEAVLPADR